jgi:4-hydroxy-tetrahydrodipicolinate synthase
MFPEWPLAAAGHAVLRRRIRRDLAAPAGSALRELRVDGLVLAATTGESLTLTSEETGRLVFAVRDEISGHKLPLCLGLAAATPALLDTLDRTASWPIDLYLISCPYYSRPSQQGLQLHFNALADRATHPAMLYNIPYRTGVNLSNEAMLRLADHPILSG